MSVMQVDESYLAKTRKRLAASAKPQQKRKIELITDDREVNQLAGGTKEAPLYVKNRQVRHLGSLLQASWQVELVHWHVVPSGTTQVMGSVQSVALPTTGSHVHPAHRFWCTCHACIVMLRCISTLHRCDASLIITAVG